MNQPAAVSDSRRDARPPTTAGISGATATAAWWGHDADCGSGPGTAPWLPEQEKDGRLADGASVRNTRGRPRGPVDV